MPRRIALLKIIFIVISLLPLRSRLRLKLPRPKSPGLFQDGVTTLLRLVIALQFFIFLPIGMKARSRSSFQGAIATEGKVREGLFAQNFSIHTLPTQRQLPVASVHCVIQDSEGYMWYGTEGGLCRDNGYQIDVFRPSISERPQEANQVNTIVENGDGDIIFGTAFGLYIINKHDYKVKPIDLGLGPLFIEVLFIDSRNHLWVGCDGAIYECAGNGKLLKSYPSLVSGSPASVSGITEGSDGTIYVLQWRSGILRRQQGEPSFTPLQWGIPATPLRMVEDEQQHSFWVLTSGAGIQHMTINGEECKLTAQSATLSDNERNHGLSMLQDIRHGLLWATTQGDIYAYSLNADGILQEVPTGGWLPEGKKILDQLWQDRDGNIYVAGFTPHTFIITAEQSDIVRRVTPAISRQTGFPLLADRTIHDGDRYIWIWQGRKGLVLYDCENDQVKALSWKPSRHIKHCSKGGIWAFNDTSVSHLWQQQGQIAEEQIVTVPEDEKICNIHESQDGMLWVATSQHLYRMPLSGKLLNKVGPLPDAPKSLDSDKQGNLYMAIGKKGLFLADSKNGVRRIDNLNDETFMSVATMSNGTVWASTYKGNVYHYLPDTGKMVNESQLNNPGGNAIKSICTDALGHVWTMTDQQVCEYAPTSHAFRIFRNTDANINVSYFYALEQMDQSHICIDGAGALIEVQSSAELNLQTTTKVHPLVSSIIVKGESRYILSGLKEIRLSSDEQEVSLNLTTLDHIHASSISFAYQVEGINREWVYLPQGINTIILNHLPKGSRSLLVKATDRYGCWSQPTKLISIYREPCWYETWWANILFLIIVLLIAYTIWRIERRIHLLRRLIHRRQEVRLDEIEMKRDDIAEQQRDDEFLRRAISKTEEHLSQPDYNVESLADDMCMSRITLYRRIQEQTGQTPTDFIRDIRLKKAATLLLQHPEATIADIARKVGFSTPKYFSRCFRNKFGVLPRDYASSQESTHNTGRNI